MCGIVAVFCKDPGDRVDVDALSRMTDMLAHRGPNDRGLYTDQGVGLGHRRLSVIDLAGGHQPMAGPSGKTWIAYNGEVYNYRELRSELVAKGVAFRTTSDTEVILALYEQMGAQCAERLNGMFAFAIWDERNRRLVVVRDRIGVKPLYVWDGPRHVVFASEIKAILEFPGVPRDARVDALVEWMMFRNLSRYRTLFKSIDAMEPGTARILDPEGCRVQRFWQLPEDTGAAISFEKAADTLEELLYDSVRLRMVADVPLGAFNSGGLDSSLVTAMATKIKQEPLRTFSVGFEDPQWDESRFARTLSRHVGSVHEEFLAEPKLFAEQLPKSIWHLDQPLTHPNSVLIRLLSGFVKPKVTVVLTGEGADELFGGYPRYKIALALSLGRPLSLPLEHTARWPLARFGGRRSRLLSTVLGHPLEWAIVVNAAYLADGSTHGVVDGQSLAARRSLVTNRGDVLQRLMRFELMTYLHGVLERMDKMTMAFGLEARVPFLDYRIIEFAATLPAWRKMPYLQTKALVKKVAERWIPRDLIRRRKSGFGVPLAGWFRDRDGLGRYVNGPAQRGHALLSSLGRPASFEGYTPREEVLWSTVNLGLWAEEFVRNSA